MIISNKFTRLSPHIPYFSLQVLERCQQNLCYPSKKLYSQNNTGLNKNDTSTDGKVVQKPPPSKFQSSLHQSSQHRILLSRLTKNHSSMVVACDKNNSDKKQTKVTRNSFHRIKYSSPWTKKIGGSLPQSHSGSRLRPSKPVKEHGVVIAISENPPRSNDGTSSGALAADRLRLARRKILQSMASSKDQALKISSLDVSSQEQKPEARNRSNNQTGGMFVVPNENPPRPSDGTSSGAVAADRLRLARRKVLQSMTSSNDHISITNSLDVVPNIDVTRGNIDRMGRIFVVSNENPPRSSDGTSSGAIAADRLRLARRKILQSMTSLNDQIPKAEPVDVTPNNDNSDVTRGNIDRMGRIFVVSNEHPPRSSDGTSSGAIAADRLRLARRKMLQSMTSSNDQIPKAKPVDVTPNNDNSDVTSGNNYRKGRIFVVTNENPPRSSDGTSSGAIAADRLQLARRKMLQSMTSLNDQIPKAEPVDVTPNNDNSDITNGNIARKGRMIVVSNENPPRSSDGTSSGAIAADRLILARKKMLQSMASSDDQISKAKPVDVTPNNDNSDITSGNNYRKGRMIVVSNEHPPRSSDGTSSGAIAADRLRLARRKMLQSMTSSEDQNHNTKN